jgi:hypothetical protein
MRLLSHWASMCSDDSVRSLGNHRCTMGVDEAGTQGREHCPGCGVSLNLEEWEPDPSNDSDYGMVK